MTETMQNTEINGILKQLQEYLQTEEAKKHIADMESEIKDVRDLMKKLSKLDKKSEEFTEWVLYGLLPYHNTEKAKRVSLFASFHDIKKFFDSWNYNYTDKEWNILANKIFDLAKGFQDDPESLPRLIKEFTNDKYSRRLQCGSISPILFSINENYPIVNNRTKKAFKAIETILGHKIGEKERLHQRLDYYLDNTEKLKELVAELGFEKLNDQKYLDLFCYWYDSKIQDKKKEEITDEEEETPEREEEITAEEVDLPVFLESIDLENASKFSPHSLRNPERIKIRDIITKVAKTEWVIPHFQRYFDWKKKDVQDFLESIFKDYYVGAFLLWDTSKDPELDVTPIKGVDVQEELRPEAIILDGQQRVTSLYYAIKAPSFHLKKSNTQLFFYINFSSFFENNDSKELVNIHTKKFSRDECFEKLLFPIYELENYDEWVNGLEDYLLDKVDDKEKVRKIRRIIDKKLKHMWEGFEIPFISLPITMGVSQVTDIFEKINTKGKLLSVFDLLIARLYKYDIELREQWDNTSEDYANIKRYARAVEKIPIYILQAISLCYHPNSSCQREDVLNIYRNIYSNPNYSFEEHWSQMSGYMNKAIEKLENLRDGFGVKDEKEIPFEPMIPVLAALLKEIDSKGNKAEYYKKLRAWYWCAIFTLSYSQAADTKMTTDFKEMKEWFEDDSKLPRTVIQMRREFSLLANKLRETQSKSSARYRGVMSLIALEGAMDFVTHQTLENARNNDKDHLFPKARRADFNASDDIDSIFNITWMSKDTNEFIKRAKKPSVYVPEFISEKYSNNEEDFLNVLKSHLITEDAYKYLKKDDFQNFLNEREKIILEKIAGIVGAENVLPQPTTLISPEKPFSNKVAFYSTIKSCDGFLYWIDKYFTQAGLELLIDSLDASKVKDLRIITSNDKVDARFRDLFKDFRDELKNKGVKVELRVITDAKLKAQIHDRWIITEGQCFNLPSADTLARGQYSEIKKTNNRPPFDEWWGKSKDIISEWDSIKSTIKAI